MRIESRVLMLRPTLNDVEKLDANELRLARGSELSASCAKIR